tara:strand:- start:501 stop:659 length:159 start_codon:yes stop_codon:yes gene_type:complete
MLLGGSLAGSQAIRANYKAAADQQQLDYRMTGLHIFNSLTGIIMYYLRLFHL